MTPQSESSKSTSWKDKSKKWFTTVTSGEPVQRFVGNKVEAESFWPKSLVEESDKAARILRSFFIDGFIVPYRIEIRAPEEVIRHCKGVVVFSVLRNGLHSKIANGSGIVVSRLVSGRWSPPSSILIHNSLDWTFPTGVDAIDGLIVINNDGAMEKLSQARCAIGNHVSAVEGPVPSSSAAEAEMKTPEKTDVWLYTKGKGHRTVINMHGTIVVERTSENERFYDMPRIKAKQILGGEVQPPTGVLSQLHETLTAVEGIQRNHKKLPPPGKCPGDFKITEPKENSQEEYGYLGHHVEERMDIKA